MSCCSVHILDQDTIDFTPKITPVKPGSRGRCWRRGVFWRGSMELIAKLSMVDILLMTALLLFGSIIASKTSGRLGVPALLLFMGIGMIVGSDGLNWIPFNNAALAQFLGVVALIFILYSGGLDTRWQQVRPVLLRGISLSTVGVFTTALIVGITVPLFTTLGHLEGFLLGAIISSTDAAAVFAILRSKGIRLKGRLRPTLELESGSNDPMAFFLTTAILQLIVTNEEPGWDMILMFLQQMIVGALMGYVLGRSMVVVVNRINLDYDGLYPVLLISMVLFTYAATDLFGGNGFLAVYLAGIVMGNDDFIHKKSLMRFYDGQAWLMQIVMFLTLGLLVFPKQLVPVVVPGLAISLVLIIVARPIAVFISLLPFGMSTARKVLVSWVGLRGAVPIIFATFPLTAGIENGALIFHIVFFIVITSVALQGTTIPLIARWLRLERTAPANRPTPQELELTTELYGELHELVVTDESPAVGARLVKLHFPPGVVITMIHREGIHLVPNGSTRIDANDRLLVLCPDGRTLRELIERLKLIDVS